MSSLNLVPNPTVIAVQTAIFIGNFIAVKKLFLEPYLKISKKREALTEGSDEQTKAINANNTAVMQKMALEHDRVNEEAAKFREQKLAEANTRRDIIMAEAYKVSQEIISSMQKSIEQALKQEKSKIPGCVDELTEVIYQKTLSV